MRVAHNEAVQRKRTAFLPSGFRFSSRDAACARGR